MISYLVIVALLIIVFTLVYCDRENLLSDYDVRTKYSAVRSELGARPRIETQGALPYDHITTGYLTSSLYAGN
jgi:hypothetical protein